MPIPLLDPIADASAMWKATIEELEGLGAGASVGAPGPAPSTAPSLLPLPSPGGAPCEDPSSNVPPGPPPVGEVKEGELKAQQFDDDLGPSLVKHAKGGDVEGVHDTLDAMADYHGDRETALQYRRRWVRKALLKAAKHSIEFGLEPLTIILDFFGDFTVGRGLVNTRSPSGNTLLIWAGYLGHLDMAKELLSRGCDKGAVRPAAAWVVQNAAAVAQGEGFDDVAEYIRGYRYTGGMFVPRQRMSDEKLEEILAMTASKPDTLLSYGGGATTSAAAGFRKHPGVEPQLVGSVSRFCPADACRLRLPLPISSVRRVLLAHERRLVVAEAVAGGGGGSGEPDGAVAKSDLRFRQFGFETKGPFGRSRGKVYEPRVGAPSSVDRGSGGPSSSATRPAFKRVGHLGSSAGRPRFYGRADFGKLRK